VSGHKFSIGQAVFFMGGMAGRGGPSGSYRIVRQMPPENGDFQYRIKSVGEAYERVARESQLERDR
jgi:hypothetical protein